MNNKISIVMAHYNRFGLLANTLDSIYNKHGHKDVQLVVVDDGSSDLTGEEKIFDFPVTYIKLPKRGKWYTNPCIPFNVGIEYSEGDTIILQNPECYHFDDVISHAINNLNSNDYFSYSCYSIPEGVDASGINRSRFRGVAAHSSDIDAWFNHSVLRPTYYHFCAATKRSTLDRVRNFSRDFALGVGFDDDDLVLKLRSSGVNMKIVDDVSVIHQFHKRPENYIPNVFDLARKNESIFMKKKIGMAR